MAAAVLVGAGEVGVPEGAGVLAAAVGVLWAPGEVAVLLPAQADRPTQATTTQPAFLMRSSPVGPAPR
jgi:hypothetical protein